MQAALRVLGTRTRPPLSTIFRKYAVPVAPMTS
jgi:hypothetical protein